MIFIYSKFFFVFDDENTYNLEKAFTGLDVRKLFIFSHLMLEMSYD